MTLGKVWIPLYKMSCQGWGWVVQLRSLIDHPWENRGQAPAFGFDLLGFESEDMGV